MRRLLLSRILLEIGWVRLALITPLLLIVSGKLLMKVSTLPRGTWAVPILLGLFLASTHRQRVDLNFLATSAPTYRRWLAVEYELWAMPVILALAFYGEWIIASLILIAVPLVAMLPRARETRSKQHRTRSLFSSEAFEWISGIRAGGWVWLILLGISIWKNTNVIGPGLCLAGWLLVVLSYYGTPEPITMLTLTTHTPRSFITQRLVLGSSYVALTTAPFLWVLAIGPVGFNIALIAGVGSLGLVGLIILTKYAFYPVALHIRSAQMLVICLTASVLINPGYLILLLLMTGRLIWQTRMRLQIMLRP